MRRLLTLGVAAFLLTPAVRAGAIDGRWDASITAGDVEIPFRIDFAGDGPDLRATLFNGEVEVNSTSGRLEGGSLVAKFDHFLGTLEAKVDGGAIVGQYRRVAGKAIRAYDFRARRHVATPAASGQVPEIGGLWEIAVPSAKGEKAWRFIVRQEGPEVRAAILRVDGDTGELRGTYRDGAFLLSHFDGSRALLAEVKPEADGALTIVLKGPSSGAGTRKEGTILTALRPAAARAKGLPEPADFDKQTTVKDPDAAFAFKFPDVDGRLVSNDDPRFQGKVVVAVVTGTWCPNCHDEVRYLVELDRKYRDQGLAIVALDFEEPEQHGGLARARAFIKKYGVEYTYLIAGAPAEVGDKLPQAVHLDSWPTTFFVGRDGLVKRVHSGFAAPASGEFHGKLREEFTATIERLLAEPPPR